MLMPVDENLKPLSVPVRECPITVFYAHSATDKMAAYKENEKMVTPGLFLPDEIIFQILSWLPVKSLLRFKCVCKIWYSIIQDPMFIDEQMNKAPSMLVYNDTGFTVIEMRNGIILEWCNSRTTFRLRNPATRCTLYLPGVTEGKGICLDMCYIRSTNELKVVYSWSSKQENRRILIFYNVLRVDTHFTWKRLDSPLLADPAYIPPIVQPVAKVIGTVFYSIRLVGDFCVDCLDLENDSILNTKIPLDLFPRWENVRILDWGGKLSLARIEQEQLHVRVLENYKDKKWADCKIIIQLTFLRDYPCISVKNIVPDAVEGNVIHWRHLDRFRPFSFDTESEKVTYLGPLPMVSKYWYDYKPSLLLLPLKVKRPQSQIEETQGSLPFKFLRLCLCGA